jgi:DNA-binding NtrC family response regulator
MANPLNCLVLEDDDVFAEFLGEAVARAGGTVTRVSTVASARERVQQASYDLVLLDNRLPDGTGYEFHDELMRRQPTCVAVMITGAPELQQAVALTRNGLFEYLTKPLEADTLAGCLARARRRIAVDGGSGGEDASPMIGDSPAMREIAHFLKQAARHRTAIVMICGETGTGKDVVSRTLHRLTFPPDGTAAPFVPLNCSALPESMVEAELFGTEKGAYTGADRRRGGLAEAAGKGTLFLDEIGEIPLSQQAKLLRFLESREYRPLGSSTTRTFEGRVVAATNRDLAAEVRAGRFRGDLLYRLDVLTLRLPPLRDHLSDLESIAQGLLVQLASKYQRTVPQLRPDDLAALLRHDFPGNVRELRNLLERSFLRTEETSPWLRLDRSGLPASVAAAAVPRTDGPTAAAPVPGAVPSSVPAPAVVSAGAERSSVAPGESAATELRRLSPLESAEYELIRKTLREESGVIRRSALRLGLTHQALLRRLQKWPELRPETGGTGST